MGSFLQVKSNGEKLINANHILIPELLVKYPFWTNDAVIRGKLAAKHLIVLLGWEWQMWLTNFKDYSWVEISGIVAQKLTAVME